LLLISQIIVLLQLVVAHLPFVLGREQEVRAKLGVRDSLLFLLGLLHLVVQALEFEVSVEPDELL
jgi:hypothetical protein